MRAGLCCLAVAALLTLALSEGAVASPQERIVSGQAASEGEYPSQGLLEFDTTSGSYMCGGSLLSNRYFLTAAHCATEPDTTTPLAPSAFTVTLGETDRAQFGPADRYSVAENQVYPTFRYTGPGNTIPENDVALLTLATPAPDALAPLRLVESGERGLWQSGTTARIIGWGDTSAGGSSSRFLLEADAPMRADADCEAASSYGGDFHPATMVCAGDGRTDTCAGDSGGPLMVSDGSFLVLAGITSWGNGCADASFPGVYTRIGEPAFNTWIRERVPMVRARASSATAQPGDRVTFTAAATDPTPPGTFTTFAWDFDSDGVADATGATVTHAYVTPGRHVALVRASGAGVDVAQDKVAVDVPAPPTPADGGDGGAPPASASTAPGATPPAPVPTGPLATILVSGRPTVSHRGFAIRVNFASAAPSGIAVIEVFKGARKIGIARTRVRRGGSKQVRVKLTPSGRRLLARSPHKRLKIKIRVRVGRQVLRSKRATIRG